MGLLKGLKILKPEKDKESQGPSTHSENFTSTLILKLSFPPTNSSTPRGAIPNTNCKK